jgi:hypothetical protein
MAEKSIRAKGHRDVHTTRNSHSIDSNCTRFYLGFLQLKGDAVGLQLTVVTQNVGRRTPCKLKFQTKVGETSHLKPENKARVGRSERSMVKCGATGDANSPLWAHELLI